MHAPRRAPRARDLRAVRLSALVCLGWALCNPTAEHRSSLRPATAHAAGAPQPPDDGEAPDARPAPAPADPARRERFLAAALASVPGERDASGRTFAPYFFVDSDDPTVDRMPLERTHAQVSILGTLAQVRLTQVYRNAGTRPLEAIYIFPASTRAAVHGLRMTIGQRVVEAVIRERQEARRIYEDAQRAGQTAGLLEQHRPNVFQMSVANILPGDTLRVELDYVELLLPEQQVYQFVLPTLVGPRYPGTRTDPAATGEPWVATPHLRAGQPSPYPFGLEAVIRGGMPVREIESPSHPVRARLLDPCTAAVELAEDSAHVQGDFVLRYRLGDGALQSGLMLQPAASGDGGHFLLLLEPPGRTSARDILPREYLFIVDVSGSMNGFPLNTAKVLLDRLLDGLRPEDRFNLLTFAGGSDLLAPASLPATRPHLEQAAALLARHRGGGGTELLPALERALALPRPADAARTVVLVTDGFVTVEKEAFALVRRALGQANLFVFGIGTSVNRHLVEGLAHAGQGEPFVVTSAAEAVQQAAAFAEYIRAPLARELSVSFAGLDAYDLEPEHIPDVFAERPVMLLGRYRGPLGGQVLVRGRTPAGPFVHTLDVARAHASPDDWSLGLLWARERIRRLADLASPGETEAHRAEITALGLTHHLLTDYTAFVAVDRLVRSDGRATPAVRVPQPLPAGVTDSAVGEGNAEIVLGGLTGAQAGESYGVGGLGLTGSGRGGGGTGEGTVGLGTLGTIGRGAGGGMVGKGGGGGSGAGYGRGAGALAARRASAPRIAVGSAQVHGALDKALIHRVIRNPLGQIQLCYERELAKAPTLAGRVLVQFTINAQGEVVAAAVKESTLNAAVDECVLAAVRRLVFPRPAGGGIVIVSYPFSFQPADAARKE